MKFLVVDDSVTMRRIIMDGLEQAGHHNVAQAVNGKDGIDLLQRCGADFIITDWNMPEMDGIDFVKGVRANPQWKSLPILMITTNSIPEEVVKAVRAGISDYIVKPFQPNTLIAKIDSMLMKSFSNS